MEVSKSRLTKAAAFKKGGQPLFKYYFIKYDLLFSSFRVMYVGNKTTGGEKVDRKEIVKSLSEHFESQARYLGAPSFAYEVETIGEIYKIDRHGIITTQDGTEVSLKDIINGQQIEDAIERENETKSIDNLELSIPMDGHSGVTLKNIVNMLSSKQHLIMKSMGIEGNLMDETFAGDLGLKTTETLDEFKTAAEELGTERCKGITFDFEKNIYTYNIPSDKLAYEKISAFAVLAARINEFAKEQKRTSYKVAQDDNPKFALRTWLIRLGMKGKGYKATRRALLENLGGNSAFRKLPNERG